MLFSFFARRCLWLFPWVLLRVTLWFHLWIWCCLCAWFHWLLFLWLVLPLCSRPNWSVIFLFFYYIFHYFIHYMFHYFFHYFCYYFFHYFGWLSHFGVWLLRLSTFWSRTKYCFGVQTFWSEENTARIFKLFGMKDVQLRSLTLLLSSLGSVLSKHV